MVEVEIKLRLPDSRAHQLLSDALAPHHVRTHMQENLFFDSRNRRLAAATAALRLRFYDDDSRAVLSLKRRPHLSDGISRVEELEEPIDPALARAAVANPNALFGLEASNIMKIVSEEYQEEKDSDLELTCLGGFRNVRAVYEWKENGLVIELDETKFEFGTSYELECETPEPEKAKGLLEKFLKEAGVPYKYSESNKFAAFMAGKLLP